ncbi:hypothetical protein Rxyl_1901 [Rubrobacter xylanophilus DSM 9941]|uniref:Uncharacterized protein n=1 Tax=Rubrobacter xylanophilus (strain DSM 9941 / JCM 11954 / NBRC 16129 / PRD-1) TaxID=266117 RepID=Q1AUS9_RUBXD|nr:hypothetical protein Rxyl_1901 [Rubrobacter xylanophilus DSM 9941]
MNRRSSFVASQEHHTHQPQGATACMQSIALTPKERKNLVARMKRERKPSRRLRMHIVFLLAADGHRPTRIARVLYCSCTTVYAVVGRFVGEEEAAFEDRGRRGPKPPLLDRSACERIVQALVGEDIPTVHGWLRSRWSRSLLVLQLFSKSGRCLLVEKPSDLPCTASSSAGGGHVPFRLPKIPKRSEKDSKRSSRCLSERDLSSRTRPGQVRSFCNFLQEGDSAHRSTSITSFAPQSPERRCSRSFSMFR